MRATLLKRVIRQLGESDIPDLHQLAEDIVVDEERCGRAQVARELKSILDMALGETPNKAGAPEAFAQPALVRCHGHHSQPKPSVGGGNTAGGGFNQPK